MNPSFKEIYTKIYVSYQGMEPNYVYYLDLEDYQIKRFDKKRFLEYERNYNELTLIKDKNPEQILVMDLITEAGKLILPKPLSDKELLQYYEMSSKKLTLSELKESVLNKTIYVWMDYHNLFPIEADDEFYGDIFYALAMVFNANLFEYFPKNNILHAIETEGVEYFYWFNRKDLSFTLTDNFLGLSNMQCMISSPNSFDKNILRTLRRAFVITFKRENRCTQETIKLYEQYEAQDCDFGAYVPKITYYENGVIVENGLRMYPAQVLNQMLFSLINMVNTMVAKQITPKPFLCYLYRHSKKTVEVDPIVTSISKTPFVNLLPFSQSCFGVKQNKGQVVEFMLRVLSYKKITKHAKAAIYEVMLVDHLTGDVLNRFTVKGDGNTIQDIMRPLIEHSYRNGWAEFTIVDNVLDSHIVSILSNGKSRIEINELSQIDRLIQEEKESPNIAA